MKYGLITIHFKHYWHCGSGQAGEGDVDLLPVIEPCGLPYVPARALRGRLKWAAREQGWNDEQMDALFGKQDDRSLDAMGQLQVANGTMRDAFAEECRRHYSTTKQLRPEVSALFEDIASTALKGGVARSKSLRRVRYAVPVTVIAEVSCNGAESWEEFEKLVPLLRAIGKGKHDGFGWCAASLKDLGQEKEPTKQASDAKPEDAPAYDLELELLDDMVLSATSATTGGHRTLDYIPGSALLGAFARVLFPALREKHKNEPGKAEREGAQALLAAGVSFGNAVPVSQEGGATLPVPISWHHAKGEPAVTQGKLVAPAIWNLAAVKFEQSRLCDRQPVQMREGWFTPANGQVADIPRTQTLKTAIDPALSNYETAKEAALFGYETIAKGTRFVSRIETRDPALGEHVHAAFDGKIIRLGRSKSTEFGRARCTLRPSAPPVELKVGSPAILLAESDLALVDQHGFPTLEPAGTHFGLAGWKLDRQHSYLRFRRYSLWNAKRGGPDIERQVICKGSVMVFTAENAAGEASPKLRVGLGQAEGLGRVRVGEDWLQSEQPKFDNASACAGATAPAAVAAVLDPNDITSWVHERHEEKQLDIKAARQAREWCCRWDRAQGKVSPSQWARLNDAAREADTLEKLLALLGTGAEDRPGEKTIFGHGRLRKKWTQGEKQGAENRDDVCGSLAQEICKVIKSQPGMSARLVLAAFREACRRMATDTRRERK
jgi:hypothetical protein